MLTSTERILTTHVGSLPRPREVVELLIAQDQDQLDDLDAFDTVLHQAVSDVVRRQRAVGIDVLSDGEMSKISYATYVRHRLSGYVVAELPRAVPADLEAFPAVKNHLAAAGETPTYLRPVCRGPITHEDPGPLQRDIARLKAALDDIGGAEGFMNAPSPGTIAIFQPNEYYATDREYLEALAVSMRHEYRTTVDAGLLLQVDCPDLALGRHTKYQHQSDDEFLGGVQERIEILNGALDGLPAASVRAHVCWGNYGGPHHLDIPLARLLGSLSRLNVGALVIEGANPRHAHEWQLWATHPLSDEQVLVPGVIDTTTNYIEHPEAVAQRICQLAELVGRGRVIAGTDCGFGTFAGFGAVDAEIVYAKLAALAEGAAIASQRLW